MSSPIPDEGTLREAVRAYTDDGFAILRSVFGPEDVEIWRRECARLAGALAEVDERDSRIQSRGHGDAGMVRDRYDPVTEFSPPFRDLAGDPRLRTIAAAVLGGSPVRFKDRLILKSSGTHGYGLHRDWPYWEFLGIPPDELVSLILSVDGSDERNGAIEVYAGLQRADLPGAPDDPRDLDPRALEGGVPSVVATAPGDVLLLHPMAPHRSGPNRSGGSRRMVTFVFTLVRWADAGERYYAERAGR